MAAKQIIGGTVAAAGFINNINFTALDINPKVADALNTAGALVISAAAQLLIKYGEKWVKSFLEKRRQRRISRETKTEKK